MHRNLETIFYIKSSKQERRRGEEDKNDRRYDEGMPNFDGVQ